jgi:hypothetical protein
MYLGRVKPKPLRTANAVLAMGSGIMSPSITAIFSK